MNGKKEIKVGDSGMFRHPHDPHYRGGTVIAVHNAVVVETAEGARVCVAKDKFFIKQ